MSGPSVQHFTHDHVTLAYRIYGSGSIPVLAFHGFGRSGTDFAVLEPVLGDRCALFAFDLHFHGQSPRYPGRADDPFKPEELASYFKAFAGHAGHQKVNLLGYSLGGRLCLSMVEHMPERIQRVFLAAPDGLKTRPWYRGLASSAFGRRLYKRFVEKPASAHAVIHTLRASRLMSERMHRFLIGQTESRIKRELVRDVWLSYRLIEPDLQRVADRVREHRIPIHLFFGKLDRIIPPRLGANLRPFAPELITQEDLPFGHVVLTRELGEAMLAHLGS